MIKVVTPESFGFDQPIAALIKRSSRGLIGADFKDLEKRAGLVFASHIKRADFLPGEVPVHVIALGTTEATGPNRNGDGFKEAVCIQYHPTFIKHAHWFRKHANKKDKGDPYYGTPRLSAFNDQMKRVELVVSLNQTKEAAARNGGRIADVELEKLAKDETLPVSMSCYVSRDFCSSCGHAAKKREEYCLGVQEGGQCKHGGLRKNMAKVCTDGHVLHAENRDPDFFDISYVPDGQADFIAHALGVVKAASAETRVIGGAEMAEMLGLAAPEWLLEEHQVAASPRLKLARKMAELERLHDQSHSTDAVIASGLPALCENRLGLQKTLPKSARLEIADALASKYATIPLQDFLELSGRDPEDAFKVAARLSGVYGRIAAESGAEAMLTQAPLPPGERISGTDRRVWAIKEAAAHSLHPTAVRSRIFSASFRGEAPPTVQVKQASSAADPAVEGAARAYALHRLACVERWQAENLQLGEAMADLVVRQHALGR